MQDDTKARHTLTRADVADRLGISTSTVRRMEWVQLHPVQDANGVWRFDPAELDGIAPQAKRSRSRPLAPPGDRDVARQGRLAARVFRMFAGNLTLAQIVVATKQPPAVVRALYHEWITSLEEAEWTRTDT